MKQDYRDQMTNELQMLMASPSNAEVVDLAAQLQMMYPYRSIAKSQIGPPSGAAQ